MSGALEIAAGARAAEQRLLARLAELCAETRRDPRLLARPVRVLVPSRSLRLHVGERVASELGATAGVLIQTLHAAALEILGRAGRAAPAGDELVEIAARRRAREEAPLREAFERFQDGYRTVAGTVRDLLDAGFEPAHEGALLERLDALRLPPAERARAAAVVRVAERVLADLEARGLGGRSQLLRRAREAFEEAPERALPARELLVHGFADATGRALDLIEALVRKLPALVLVDRPPDPDEPAREDLGAAFTERLVTRLAGTLGPPREPARAPEGRTPGANGAARPELFRAPGAEAEVRAVARRVRTLLERGARPERIGIVARELGPYRFALRTQLSRLGIPFSALRARAPLDGPARRVHALLELVEQRARAPADRWLDAVAKLAIERDGKTEARAPSPALRLGLRVLGAARLAEAAALELDGRLDEKGRLKLPVRAKIGGALGPEDAPGADGAKSASDAKDAGGAKSAHGTEDADGAEDANGSGVANGEHGESARPIGFHAVHCRLGGAELAAARKAAAAALRRLARWPERAPLAQHLDLFERLRHKELGWRRNDRAEQRVLAAVDRLRESLPAEELHFDELALLLRRALAQAAAPALGGEGGGVQVLGAMEARARTFEHLFVLGLNRDAFPRVVREDPLFGDDVRRALLELLPDLPIKARGRDEDRYLFAQLVSSAPAVTLSWQITDDDGKPRVISPLVERLLREQREDEVETAPPLFPQDPARAAAGGPRTAHEHAILGGLHERSKGLASRLALALEESHADPEPRRLAEARARIVDAFEEGPFQPERLAPWLGFLGAQEAAGVRPDPRIEPLGVTRVEALARCPWQTVLRSFLKIEPAPDPLDALPGIEPRMVGNVVHRVLQEIAEEVLGKERLDLDAVAKRKPVRAPWPDAKRYEALLLGAVERAVREEREPTPGLVRMLAEVARPHLERARAILEAEARGASLLGVEVHGRARVPLPRGGELEVGFRADRVDLRDQTLVLTDYKTGKAKTWKEMVTAGIPQGTSLQPIVYALGAVGRASSVRGRYLFLKPDTEESDVGLGAEHKEHVADLSRALGATLDAWLAGSFFPRLHDEKLDHEPDACKFCDVAQACLRGDSGARRALIGLAAREGESPLRGLWRLPQAERGQPHAGRPDINEEAP